MSYREFAMLILFGIALFITWELATLHSCLAAHHTACFVFSN